MSQKRVIILGSTGSIGCNTLEVLRELTDEFQVVGLAAGSRCRELAEQAKQFQVEYIAIGDESLEPVLRADLPKSTTVLAGADGLVELVEASNCDIVVSAIVGTAGLAATIRAAQMGKRIAIANKETLVVAGSLITQLAKQSGAELIPVDSEHSAIFQALHAGRRSELRRVYLTASGGPFLTWSRDRIRQATVADALAHPIWDMGPKISIDSATMVNKALEIVEARWLFDLPADKIEVLVHPQAVVHSMVEFQDGCLIAQLGTPDMRTPIQYALTYPRRLRSTGEPLDMLALGSLNFEAPDLARFPALQLGFEVATKGGSAGAVLNAANEAAVDAFRAGHIEFGDIADRVAGTLSRHQWIESPTMEELLQVDAWARNEVRACLSC